MIRSAPLDARQTKSLSALQQAGSLQQLAPWQLAGIQSLERLPTASRCLQAAVHGTLQPIAEPSKPFICVLGLPEDDLAPEAATAEELTAQHIRERYPHLFKWLSTRAFSPHTKPY